MCFDIINSYVLNFIFEKRNFRFNMAYETESTLQKFFLVTITSFLPYGYVAFYKKSYLALYTLMLMNMTVEPFKATFLRFLKPYFPDSFGNGWYVKKRVDQHLDKNFKMLRKKADRKWSKNNLF